MGRLTLPGLIDPHVHLRDPYQMQKEDFYTGTCAALAGGYTTIMDMPNNQIPTTTLERLEEKIQSAKQKIVCDVGFYYGSLGDNLADFQQVEPHVLGLKLYLNETTGNFLISKEKITEIIRAWHAVSAKPILFHAEDDAIAHVIDVVSETKVKTHFCHISLQSDLQQIIDAKAKGLPVSCGVTPHHLFLTEEDANRLGSYGRMKPPLAKNSDVAFFWEHLSEIDAIESDHAPHTREEKEHPPGGQQAPYGVPGLETTLPLLLTAVSENKLTTEDIIRLCITNPSHIFGVKNDPKTMIEVDTDEKYTIEHKNLFTKCAWSPFTGREVTGKVKAVIIRGTRVFENGKILVDPGFGNVLPIELAGN